MTVTCTATVAVCRCTPGWTPFSELCKAWGPDTARSRIFCAARNPLFFLILLGIGILHDIILLVTKTGLDLDNAFHVSAESYDDANIGFFLDAAAKRNDPVLNSG